MEGDFVHIGSALLLVQYWIQDMQGTYIMIAVLVKFNAKQRAKVTINTTLHSSLHVRIVSVLEHDL